MGRRFRDTSKGLTERERLLTEITTHLTPFTPRCDKHNLPPRDPGVHWWIGDPVVGDLVRATSSGVHPFTWGYIVALQDEPYGTWVVRDLVSDRVCNITNDSFYALRGIPKRRLLYGHQRAFFIKVQKAIQNLGDHYCRFQDIAFDAPRRATITVRPHLWAVPTSQRDLAASTVMAFTPRTPIRDIEAHISANCPQTSAAWGALCPQAPSVATIVIASSGPPERDTSWADNFLAGVAPIPGDRFR